METINRLTKIITIIAAIALIAAVGAALWGIYKYIPDLREKIRGNTAKAVAQWFPAGAEGGFSYDMDISLSPRRCRLIDLHVTKGSGEVLKDIKLNEYEFKASAVEIDLDAILNDKPVNIKSLEGVEFKGEILLADMGAYYTPEKSGVSDIRFDYDEFTEKVMLKFDMTELPIGETTVTGKMSITAGGDGITLTERRYFNIEGPMPDDIIRFIEEHTNIDIQFSIFDFPLKVKSFSLKGKTLNVELEME